MTHTDLLDKTFMLLYTMDDPYVFPQALPKKLAIGNSNPITLLDTIYEIGFASREKNSQQSLGGSNATIYNYWKNTNGKIFIENLPPEFNYKPYSYYRKNLEIENADKLESEKLTKDKLKIDFQNATRIFKTYWWTFGIAVAAFLISLVLLILKIRE